MGTPLPLHNLGTFMYVRFTVECNRGGSTACLTKFVDGLEFFVEFILSFGRSYSGFVKHNFV